MQTILSIVPRLPPVVDGVGDYAHLLSAALADRHGILTKFIACDPLKPVLENHYPRFNAASNDLSPIQLPQRSKDELLSILDRHVDIDTILLHYVGYGYAKRGCPFWLRAALSKWRQAKSSRKLVTMFHEVYAKSERPWSSQFWTSPIQQQIAKDLVDLSDAVMTSNQLFVNLIQGLSNKHDRQIDILPVFSTIGECSSPLPLTQRQPWLVTFGNSQLRKSIYTDSLKQLATVCQQLEIKEIYDIGHNSSEIVRSIPAVKVNAMGVLPAAEIAQIFSNVRVGFINYSIPYVAKSTIFAAYCSHQLLSVFDNRNLGNNLDGIKLDRHYWSARNTSDSIDLDTAQSIANNAYQWYDLHNLNRVAIHFANLLSKS
jgi:hypothetical protein